MELLIVLIIVVALVYFINKTDKEKKLDKLRPTVIEISSIEEEIDNIEDSVYESSNEKWDYKIVDNLSTSQLSELGKKGWELVGVATYQTGGGVSLNGFGSSKYTVQIRYALKRKIIKNNRENEVIALREKAKQLREDLIRKELEMLKKHKISFNT